MNKIKTAKIIFIDDDVLCNGHLFNCPNEPTDIVNEESMANLNRIIRATKCRLVLIGDCRKEWLKPYKEKSRKYKRLETLFRKYAIPVMGVTQIMGTEKNVNKLNEIDQYITKYLSARGYVLSSFIIIDNDDYGYTNKYGQYKYVKPSNNSAIDRMRSKIRYKGITHNDADMIIQRLNATKILRKESGNKK